MLDPDQILFALATLVKVDLLCEIKACTLKPLQLYLLVPGAELFNRKLPGASET